VLHFGNPGLVTNTMLDKQSRAKRGSLTAQKTITKGKIGTSKAQKRSELARPHGRLSKNDLQSMASATKASTRSATRGPSAAASVRAKKPAAAAASVSRAIVSERKTSTVPTSRKSPKTLSNSSRSTGSDKAHAATSGRTPKARAPGGSVKARTNPAAVLPVSKASANTQTAEQRQIEKLLSKGTINRYRSVLEKLAFVSFWPKTDMCMVCQDGGHLLCCESDGCTNSCHIKCAGLDKAPRGPWECFECRDTWGHFCMVCDDGGPMLCCVSCSNVAHTRCAGLTRAPKGDWACPQCKAAAEQAKQSKEGADADQDDYDPWHDECMVCQKPGDQLELLCCASCANTGHISCLGLPGNPRGSWFCPQCTSGATAVTQFEQLGFFSVVNNRVNGGADRLVCAARGAAVQ